jgi:hypothetical protein
MQENQNTEEVKEPVIGNFKPKRKFLNFVSAVNGARIRFIRDIAFLKGEKLSGVLEGTIFKITICDEGTIKFEEQEGTNLSDESMIKRLIDEIDSTDVTGYAQKFVVANLEFSDIDGKLCYLEVEHKKPIDKFKSLFDEDEVEQNTEKVELSDRGFSILDALFSSETDEELEREFDGENEIILSEKDAEIFVDALVNPSEPNEKLKQAAESYMEEQFRKMNEEKVRELKFRIEDAEKESERLRREISMSESKLKKQLEDLKVLETRLDSFSENDEPNGYVFYVSEEQKAEDIGLTDENRQMADKIADIVGLKKDVLFKMLTEGHYKIRIAEKSDIKSEKVKMTSEILEKMKSLVNSDESKDSKITMVEPGHFEYRGSMTWHQIVGKMIRKGFQQEPDFDKHCQSNSYESHEEEKVDQSVEPVVENSQKTSTEIKSKIVQTYNEETTLVVVGTTDHNDDSDVEITDDYTGFGIYVGGKKFNGSYESDGFISIMTLDNFKKWQSSYPEFLTDGGGVESFILPNFKGTISVTAKVDEGFTNQFDLSDFIQHQDGMEDAEVYLVLPEGTEVIKMDDYHKVPVSAIRDIKIDKIVE